MRAISVLAVFLTFLTIFLVGTAEYEQSRTPSQTVVLDGTVVEEKDKILPEAKLTTFTSLPGASGKRINIQVPVDTDINEAEGHITVTYSGINETLEDKVVDGYSLDIILHENTTVDAILERHPGVLALQPSQLTGSDGDVFLTKTPESEETIDHYIFSIGANQVIDVSYTVAGENTSTYRETILEIVKSIEITT